MTSDPRYIADSDASLLQDVLNKALAEGAEAADAVLLRSASMSHAIRLGQPESLEREEGQDLGLRVLIGRRQAIASSTDLSANALRELVERAVAMARVVTEDRWCGLAAPEQLASSFPDVDSNDPAEPAPEVLVERARICEEAALGVAGVSNSEGAEAGWSSTRMTLAASNGFVGSYAGSRHSVGVSVLAGEGLRMQRDYDFSSTVYGADLEDPVTIGRSAGQRTLARLDPRKPKTGRVPVIFDPRVANSLLRHLAAAINGAAIARGTSFLKDRLGQEVMSAGIAVVDDPHRRRGLRSRPFDAEGLPTRRMEIVQDGRLTTWLLDLATARQLGLEPTGHAGRGVSGPPAAGASNLYMVPGQMSQRDLLADTGQGFYVTELIGMGVNAITGDYSRGASGFWIENGELSYPVSEATIAGNLKDMFRNLTPANDLVFKYGTDAPTVRVEGMTVAGA